MTKIYNASLANTEVVFSFGTLLFDEDGIVDITPDENAELLMGIGSFIIVDGALLETIAKAKEKVEQTVLATATEADAVRASSTDPLVPEFIKKATEEAEAQLKAKVDALTDKQKNDEIDAVAKQLGFEYPEGATTKAEKVEAIKKYVAGKE